MNRPFPKAARTGATVVGIAAGLLALGYSGQSTDGYVHVAFTGPLGLFGPDSVDSADTDLIAIGGPGDAAALAALLKSTAPRGSSAQPNRVSLESGNIPNSNQVKAFPAVGSPASAGPAAAPLAAPSNTPTVDEQGQVDCTGAVTCQLDPKTNVTTVTYSDGTMAIVQRINGMTLVAYKNVPVPESVNGKTSNQAKSPAPQTIPVPQPVAVVPAKPAPSPLASVAVPSTTTTPEVPAVDSVPEVNAGPATTTAPTAPIPGITAGTVRPRVTVTKPPQDYSPSRPGGAASTNANKPGVSGAFDAVKEAVTSVVDAVGKAVNPGASTGATRSNAN